MEQKRPLVPNSLVNRLCYWSRVFVNSKISWNCILTELDPYQIQLTIGQRRSQTQFHSLYQDVKLILQDLMKRQQKVQIGESIDELTLKTLKILNSQSQIHEMRAEIQLLSQQKDQKEESDIQFSVCQYLSITLNKLQEMGMTMYKNLRNLPKSMVRQWEKIQEYGKQAYYSSNRPLQLCISLAQYCDFVRQLMSFIQPNHSQMQILIELSLRNLAILAQKSENKQKAKKLKNQIEKALEKKFFDSNYMIQKLIQIENYKHECIGNYDIVNLGKDQYIIQVLSQFGYLQEDQNDAIGFAQYKQLYYHTLKQQFRQLFHSLNQLIVESEITLKQLTKSNDMSLVELKSITRDRFHAENAQQLIQIGIKAEGLKRSLLQRYGGRSDMYSKIWSNLTFLNLSQTVMSKTKISSQEELIEIIENQFQSQIQQNRILRDQIADLLVILGQKVSQNSTLNAQLQLVLRNAVNKMKNARHFEQEQEQINQLRQIICNVQIEQQLENFNQRLHSILHKQSLYKSIEQKMKYSSEQVKLEQYLIIIEQILRQQHPQNFYKSFQIIQKLGCEHKAQFFYELKQICLLKRREHFITIVLKVFNRVRLQSLRKAINQWGVKKVQFHQRRTSSPQASSNLSTQSLQENRKRASSLRRKSVSIAMQNQQEQFKPMPTHQLFKLFEEMIEKKNEADKKDIIEGKPPKVMIEYLSEFLHHKFGISQLKQHQMIQIIKNLRFQIEEKNEYAIIVARLIGALNEQPIPYIISPFIVREWINFNKQIEKADKILNMQHRNSRRGSVQSRAQNFAIDNGGKCFVVDCIDHVYEIFKNYQNYGKTCIAQLQPPLISLNDYIIFIIASKMAKLGFRPEQIFDLIDADKQGITYQEFGYGLKYQLDLWIEDFDIQQVFQEFQVNGRISLDRFRKRVQIDTFSKLQFKSEFMIDKSQYINALLFVFEDIQANDRQQLEEGLGKQFGKTILNYFNFSEILDSIDETAHDHKTILFKKLQQNPKGVTISGIVDIILQYGISNYGSGPFSLLSLNLLLPFTQEKQPVKKISTKYYTPVKSRRRFSQKP